MSIAHLIPLVESRVSVPSAPHVFDTVGTGSSGSPKSIVFDANGNVYIGAVDGDNYIRKFDASGNPLT
jgi:sugar lactone lactonase YvrE